MTRDSMTKKILVPIFNRAHYGRLRSVLRAVDSHPKLKLQVITATPAAYSGFFSNIIHSRPRSWRLALPWYVRAKLLSLNPKNVRDNDLLTNMLLSDGFPVDAQVPFFLDGGVSDTMAKTVGFGIVRLVDELKKLQPDIVFVNADRFEMMALAIAASYLNIPVAHNEGGDVSGTIDESVRHAITKLAHLHFVATKESHKRVVQMGENPRDVFLVGSPTIDTIKELDIATSQDFAGIDTTRPYLLVLLHPVSTESREDNNKMARNLIRALGQIDMPVVFLGSNIDAGSHELGEAMREWARSRPDSVFFTKHLPPDSFYCALANAACAVGNSSSFIREGGYFGTPAVIVGSRQKGRERCGNVVEVGIEVEEIKEGIAKQLKRGRYQKDFRFGNGTTGQKIADLLAEIEPQIQKQFYDKQ